MKKLNVMEKRNRFFLLALVIAILAVVAVIFVPLNRTATLFGGYRLTYTYDLTPETLDENENPPADITTLFPNMVIAGEKPEYIPMDMAAVKDSAESAIGTKVNLLTPEEQGDKASEKVTFEVMSIHQCYGHCPSLNT